MIGLSPDSPQKLAEFKSKYRLPFILASDSKGVIRKIIKGLVNPDKHVRESLEYFSRPDRS